MSALWVLALMLWFNGRDRAAVQAGRQGPPGE